MFVHLHNHSDYSLLDGACRIPKLVEAAVGQGSPAVALTDHGNLFGLLEFYTKAKDAGIKPIIGVEVYVAANSRFDKKASKGGEQRYHLVLLAKNYTGYKNLSKLTSESYTTGFYYKPRIDKDLLMEHTEGLICMSGCIKGEIPQLIIDGNLDVAREAIKFYHDLFGDDYYLEIMRHGIPAQDKTIPHIAQFAEEFGIKLVATNDAHYLKKEHAKAHDILLCIGTQSKVIDQKRLRFENDEFYFKTPDQMAELFHDYPEAIENTLEVAEKCNIEIKLDEQHYPVFDIPAGEDLDAGGYLKKLTYEGFKQRYGDNPPEEAVKRVENELEVIAKTGFSNYFLIVWDFVRWAKERGIPVGPGRGSAAGCTVSYCLGITNLDPTRFGLIFERFLNPERVSPPDIDIDFSDERREEVIQYVRDKYGDDSVCRITTFGKMAAKSAVRDVARTLSLPYGESDKIARLIPEGPKVKLKKSYEEVPELKKLIDSDPRYQEVWENALIIEGLVRHSGTHAAGVVICPGKTVEFIPVYKMAGEGEEYTQFDMNWVDRLGLLKMDFLGLQTLSELDRTVKSLKKRGVEIDLNNLPLDDYDTFKLFGEGATIGVFQFESRGMRENLAKLKPQRIEDIMAMAALYRPGPMDNIPEYIACQHGKKQPKYLHEKLERILKETYGVIIYQEQVMRVATDLAGFTLGKADILRKAMGKKKVDVMEKLKPEFLEGAVQNNIDKEIGLKTWEDCKEFAKYGFVKAHAAGYGLIAYQCAYLKTHYPADYLASCLTVRRRNPSMVMKLLAECKARGISVLPPDINESEFGFVATGEGVRFGLSAIKNVGDAAVKAIVEAKKEHKRFKNFHDFLTSVDLGKVNRRVCESLIDAGAFDAMGCNRASLFVSLQSAMAYAQAIHEERERGQTTLFGGVGVDPAVHIPPPDLKEVDEWPVSELQSREKTMLGYYISSHPLEQYSREVKGISTHNIGDKEEFKDGARIRSCCVATSVKVRTTQSGHKMAVMVVEDQTGAIECVAFPKVYANHPDILFEDQLLAINGKISRKSDEEAKIWMESAIPLEEAAEKWGNSLHIKVDKEQINERLLSKLESIFTEYEGQVPIYIAIAVGNGTVRTLRAGSFAVRTGNGLLKRLSEILGKEAVHIGFNNQ